MASFNNFIETRDDELFEQRKLVGNNLLSIIKDTGYTKSSFSKVANISRPTLDKLINGEVDSKATFISHIKKIIDAGITQCKEILEYRSLNNDASLVKLYSDNAPNDYKRNNDTKEIFMILDDLINLSELYK